MNTHSISLKELNTLAFQNRENNIEHFLYEQEMALYAHMKAGNVEAVSAEMKQFSMSNSGTLSQDPLRNALYHFIAGITLACRFCIEGGMDPAEAFNASDLYIQKADLCKHQDEVSALYSDMMLFYTEHMAALRKQMAVAKPVALSLDYINQHLHTPIRLEEIAEHAGVSTPYLSTLFKQETGMTVTGAITRRRIEVAKNLLCFSDYSITEISEYLAFNTPNYFNRVFRRETGMTPSEYRHLTFRKNMLFHNALNTNAEPSLP